MTWNINETVIKIQFQIQQREDQVPSSNVFEIKCLASTSNVFEGIVHQAKKCFSCFCLHNESRWGP